MGFWDNESTTSRARNFCRKLLVEEILAGKIYVMFISPFLFAHKIV